MATILFKIALAISEQMPQCRFGHWWFFNIVDPLYKADWKKNTRPDQRMKPTPQQPALEGILR